MKVGIVYIAYSMPDYILGSLQPWIDARAQGIAGNSYVIAAVSLPFKGYEGEPLDEVSPLKLDSYKDLGLIDAVFKGPKYCTEWEARNLALNYLLERGCDIIWLVDNDEEYAIDDITNIFNFIKLNTYISHFRISFKNYVFDNKHYLSEPFCPPRIFKVKTNGHTLKEMIWDNDASYTHDIACTVVHFNMLPTMTIPKNVAWICHHSWLNNIYSKKKIEYQTNARGWQCSYKWDEKEGLKFNEDFFKSKGLPLPEVLEDV
jgi:hypothetical protein